MVGLGSEGLEPLKVAVKMAFNRDEGARGEAMKADLHTTESENTALTRRLDTLATENAGLVTRLKVAEKQIIALSEANFAKAVEIEKGKVTSALAQARPHNQQVLDCDAEIKTLHKPVADRDVTLQGFTAKHFEQLQESARLLN
ncbi:hypothetical protein GQ600_25830 [Phytophthora cactorum]|nr:hypothetical protein GQ600_25830 [Phytophthora cactorum]